MRKTLAGLCWLLLAGNAHAATALSFEQRLSELHRDIMAARGQQLRDNKAALAGELAELSRSTSGLNWDIYRLRHALDNIRMRARLYQNGQAPDAAFQSDLKRITWDMRGFGQKIAGEIHTAQRLYRAAAPDADLVAPAARLNQTAQEFLQACATLSGDSDWAVREVMRTSLRREAAELGRESDQTIYQGRVLVGYAQAILKKVQPAPARGPSPPSSSRG